MLESETLAIKVEHLEAANQRLEELLAVREHSFSVFERPASALSAIFGYVFLPVFMAVALYVALAISYPAEFVLRLAVIVLAALTGHTLQKQRRPTWLVTMSFAILVAVGAVIAMAATTYLVSDQHPSIIPKSPPERQDNTEYMVSIALAYLIGAVAALYTKPLELPLDGQNGELSDVVVEWILQHIPSSDRHGKTTKQTIGRYRLVVRAALSLLMFLVMAWTGFSRFLPEWMH